jgi:hypothetical protein
MTDPFEYDVFISFSSADEQIVKPIWQELCSNGLRVFWSDASLKKEVGNSWFEVIEKSLERSRHMLLICSENSMNSKWVQREYRAFFDYCYSADSRRLIPLLTHDFKPVNLPLFLRELQVGKVTDLQFIHEIIPILGGVNIEKLKRELQSLKEQANLLTTENESLGKRLRVEINKINTLTQENIIVKEQITKLSSENISLKEQIAKLTKESNAVNAKLHEQENSFWGENISLKEQISSLKNQNELLNKRLKEQENVFSQKNTSLNYQTGKLAKENNPPNGKLQNQEKSFSKTTSALTVKEEERKRVEKYGIEVTPCPKCGRLNSLALIHCENCHTNLNNVKPIRNPYL